MKQPLRGSVGAARGGVVAAVALVAIIAAAVTVGFAVRAHRTPDRKPLVAATAPSTLPASAPSTAPAAPAPKDYISLVLAEHPDFPTTEPMAIPVADLNDAAHIVLNQRIYLDNVGDLWITHPDAPPVASLVRDAADEQTHLTRDQVVFAFRMLDEKGKVQQQVIIDHGDGLGVGGQLELVGPQGRIEVGS